jgi:hypothetical protein
MRGFWHEHHWTVKDGCLLLPNGCAIPLSDIVAWWQSRINGNMDLAGQWSGWRVRQQFLLQPSQTMRSRIKITPATLRAFSRWADGFPEERRQLELF